MWLNCGQNKQTEKQPYFNLIVYIRHIQPDDKTFTPLLIIGYILVALYNVPVSWTFFT